MVKSSAATVDDYLDEVPEARRDALERLRQQCIEALGDYEETMQYGMPSYRRPGGEVEVAFASQARHISLYIMRQEVLDQFRDDLATANLGKGCVRYSSPSRIDHAVVDRMLVASAAADGEIC
ncbi:MAG TPA: DUF1801 domain-containing protein [Nitriliruptoraceae bacterium]|nr:DUF1801 domain-containing protein [Nitriliruptoraceae bacterium]